MLASTPQTTVDADRNAALRRMVPWLFGCAVFSMYFASNVVQLDRQMRDSMQLAQTAQRLTSVSPAVSEDRALWLVKVQQLLPFMQDRAHDQVSVIVSRMQDLLTPGTAAYSDPVVLSAEVHSELTLLMSQLQQVQMQIQQQQAALSQRLFWALLIFALLMTLIWQRPWRAATPAMERLLEDESLFPNLPNGVALCDAEGRILRTNSAFRSGADSAANVVGQPLFEEPPAGLAEALAENGVWRGEYQQQKSNGDPARERMVCIGLNDNDHGLIGSLCISLDVPISDEGARLMLWQAHHDNLTKLPNLNLLHDRLKRELLALPDGQLGALISIDIDDFNQINDSVGQASGDRIIMETATRIALCARETDLVARRSEDVFAVAMFGVEDSGVPEEIAQQMVEALANPYFLESQEIHLTASAGVAMIPADGQEKGELLRRADSARQQAKKRGGGQIAFFETDMDAAAGRRQDIVQGLRHAIANQELMLHYQPIIELRSGRVYGAEALVRWESEDLGWVSPGEFIPVAEHTGQIVEIGEQVLQMASDQLLAWQAESDWHPLRISFNVSARQFANEDDAVRLLEMLDKAPVDWLTVELTESALIADDPGSALFLAGLKKAGVWVALDDFGTGYSSIGYLRDFEFNVLKIDRSFIRDLPATRDMGLVASIIAMGRILGLRIVTEGVEEVEQVEHLRRIGCDYIQGYYYAKPMPADEFMAFVRNNRIASTRSL